MESTLLSKQVFKKLQFLDISLIFWIFSNIVYEGGDQWIPPATAISLGRKGIEAGVKRSVGQEMGMLDQFIQFRLKQTKLFARIKGEACPVGFTFEKTRWLELNAGIQF